MTVLLLNTLILLALSVYTYNRRSVNGGQYLVLLLTAIAFWSLTALFEEMAETIPAKVFWSKLCYAGVTSAAPLFFLFILTFCSFVRRVKPWHQALLWIIPLIVFVAASTNELHGLVWPSVTYNDNLPGHRVAYTHGPLVGVLVVYSYFLFVASTAIIIRTAITTHRLYRSQNIILIVSSIIPWAGNFIYLTKFELQGFDITPLSFTITGILITIGITRYRFINIAPIAYDTLFRNITNGVLVLDKSLRVTNLNPSIMTMLNLSDSDIGKHVSKIPALGMEITGLLSQNIEGNSVLKHISEGKTRWLDITSSSILNYYGHNIGSLHCFWDITAQKNTEEQLIAEKTRSETIINATPNIVVGLGERSRIMLFNKYAEKLTGYTAEEVMGREWIEIFIPPEMRQEIYGVWEKIVTSNAIAHHYENLIITKTDERRLISWNNTVLKEDGRFRMVLSIGEDITERKRAEEALQKSEKEYRELSTLLRLMSDNMPDMLWAKNLNNEYIFANKTICTDLLNAKDTEEPLGKTDLFFAMRERNSQPDNPEWHTFGEICRDSDAATLEAMKPMQFDEFGNVKGKFLFLDVHKAPLYDNTGQLIGVVGSARDVTAAKEVENQLRKLSQAVEQSPASVVITDLKGTIEYVNPKFTEVTGYTLEEAIGQNPRILKSGEQPSEVYTELWKTISSGKKWKGEFLNKKKNGELFWESAQISPIKNEKGELLYYLGVKEDITEWKRAEAQLIKAKDKAEESDRLKTAFLHNISHEIRTPMNAIIGFSALLSEPDLTDESKAYFIENITNGSNHLLSIINDIVDISSIEAGIVRISKEKILINSTLKRLEDQFSLRSREKGIELRTVKSLPDEDAIIIADNTKFIQVITNLLNNAFKFTERGTIEFGYKPGKDFIEFYVSDTGIGIPGDQLTRIFDRFYQVDFKMARLSEGTGLGLSISKSFVELMGGKIWVVSEMGKGSTFFFTLPSGKSYKKKVTVHKDNQKHTFDREFNILVAEDNKLSSQLIDIILAIPNLKVTKVYNGAEAVDHCRTGKPVDLVLMDIKMPVMDGFEATKLIRKLLPKLPIIAQTAYAGEEDKEKAIKSGCNDVITKPFSKETLISIIMDNLSL